MNERIQYLKSYLKKVKMTYEQLAEKSGVSVSTLKDIFRGATTGPRIATVQRIERALGIEGQKESDIIITEEDMKYIHMIYKYPQLKKLLDSLDTEENAEELNDLFTAFYVIANRKK